MKKASVYVSYQDRVRAGMKSAQSAGTRGRSAR